MTQFFEFVENGDPCATIILSGTLLFVGRKMTANRPDHYLWGLRIATAVFLGFGIYGYIRFQPTDAEAMMSLVFRALLAGALVMGITWIVLAVYSFVHRAYLTGFQRIKSQAEEKKRRSLELQTQGEREEQRRREQEEYERLAPERKLAADTQLQEKRRRHSAYAEAEKVFLMFAADIKDRFTREDFDNFVSKFIDDPEQPLDVVESRSNDLQQIIKDLAGDKPGKTERSSFAELMEELQRQIAEIETSDLPDRTKQNLIASIRQTMVSRLHEKMEE